jgi:hypothetical protein
MQASPLRLLSTAEEDENHRHPGNGRAQKTDASDEKLSSRVTRPWRRNVRYEYLSGFENARHCGSNNASSMPDLSNSRGKETPTVSRKFFTQERSKSFRSGVVRRPDSDRKLPR